MSPLIADFVAEVADESRKLRRRSAGAVAYGTPARRLARLEREIAANAATWTTAEHRRSAARTIYYHENDLPPDVAQRAAPFERLMDRILAKMPAPVSHIGHFQWLPAVRDYRQDMSNDESSPMITLLEDPRNLVSAK